MNKFNWWKVTKKEKKGKHKFLDKYLKDILSKIDKYYSNKKED